MLLWTGHTGPAEHSACRSRNVTVIDWPALEKLGSDAATGSGLDFTRKAKASFTYTGSSSSLVGSRMPRSLIRPARSWGAGLVGNSGRSCTTDMDYRDRIGPYAPDDQPACPQEAF
ncbi:hypothetical protein [Streptomyces sp. NPDC021622]|uniref:hypothetical protein n=1 Tax=Streptomyces sp. NPDC021622 TaxID=3155013 RepID=UPI0033C9A8D2